MALDVPFDRIERGVASLDGVVGVISPYDPAGAVQVAPAGPDAGKLAFARISFDPALQQSDFLRLTDEVRTALPTLDGLQIELGGQVFAEFQPPESELLGLAFAVIILLLAFGSLTHKQQMRSLQLFATEIMPTLKVMNTESAPAMRPGAAAS